MIYSDLFDHLDSCAPCGEIMPQGWIGCGAPVIPDVVSLLAAEEYLKRGNRAEAMIHLGRALGGIWAREFAT